MNKNTKMWIGIGIALVLLIGGFYLYYFYPQVIPGMASISPELKKEVNILVVGMDDRDSVKKGEIEADSLVLIKLRAKEKELNFISIPPDIVVNGKPLKDMPFEDMLEKIKELYGVNPDYHFSIGYKGFEKIVDELGGININLDSSLRVRDLELDLKAGNNHLSGKEALSYSRWYDYTKDEIDRIQRQQQVIAAILQQAFKPETLLKVPNMFSATVETMKSIDTDLDQNLIAEIVDFLRNRDNLKIDYSIINNTNNN